MSLLPPASKIVITGGSFVHNNQNDNATKDLTPLYDNVAPNAILNYGGRADPVRCHPGTREEVIEKMEKRIRDYHGGDRGVFWLSGPAGAGKSAIMQTVAERCIERKVPMVNFFFFRADGTRNHSDTVVATLLYQLFVLFPPLRAHVAAIASKDPVVFRQSMAQQFSTLIDKPLQDIKAYSDAPLVILIDGLDECSFGNGKDDQVSLLNILHDISTRPVNNTAPAYVVPVASRTEAHLTMAFKRSGCHPNSIYLDESYRPSDDIRAFLTDRFADIRQMHNLSDTLPANWPSPTDLDAIVEKSSGQFVYPATVARFISDSAASPERSLEIVLGLRPPTRTSPFAALDSLYTYILSQAEDWKSVRDILAMQNIQNLPMWQGLSQPLPEIIRPLGYTQNDVLSCLSDLTAIMRFRAGDERLTVYHASLNDFLIDKSRAGEFYVDVNAFACRLAPLHFRQCTRSYTLHYSFRILEGVTEPDERLTDFLKLFLPDPEPFRGQRLDSTSKQDWMRRLAQLYYSRDPALHENMRKRWQKWFSIVDGPSEASKSESTAEQTSSLQAAATVSKHQPSQRTSTSLSRLFSKFTPRRSNEIGTKK